MEARLSGLKKVVNLVRSLKEPGFVLSAKVSNYCQHGIVAEWSACPPIILAARVRFLVPLRFSFFHRGVLTKERLRTPLRGHSHT